LKCYDQPVSPVAGVSTRQPRGGTASGGAGVVVGLVLFGLGTGLGLAGLNAGGHPEARPMGLTMGGAFALIGLVVGAQGARAVVARSRRRHVLAAHPAEPWLADHAWRREGVVDDSASQARGALVGGGVMTALVSTAASAMLGDAEGPGLFVLITLLGLFMAVGLGLIARGVYLVLRRSRHGLAELRFARFPFLLGEPLEVALVREQGAPRLQGLTATLSCVVERWVEREVVDHRDDAPRGRSSRALKRAEVWRAEKPVAWVHGGRIPIRFELPAPGGAAVGTALSEDPPRYWELSLHADLPGLDFGATFLVPVYEKAKPAAPVAGEPDPAG
jgi:hypothetical protein